MLPIRLETLRFPGGYSPPPANPDADPEPEGMLLARGSSEPLIIEAMSLEDPLFIRLNNCRGEEDLIKFLGRFWDQREVQLESARDFWTLMRETTAATFGRSGDHADRPIDPVNELLKFTAITTQVRLIDGVSRMVLIAACTEHFLGLEFAAAVEAGVSLAHCAHCDKQFLFGPLTGRRSHAKFCSDRCRVAAMRARNVSGGK